MNPARETGIVAPAAFGGLALELGHAGEIEPRLKALAARYGATCPSEYAFANLYLFRREHAYRYLPGPQPCVAGVTYDGARHLLPLFDLRETDHAALAGMLDGYDCFYPIAGATVAGLDSRLFRWSESPDDADYFYPAENFRTYRGELLRKKRSLMQQLLEAHRVEPRPLTPGSAADALSVLRQWIADKGRLPGEADARACEEAITLSAHFGLDGSVYYADGEPAGLLIAQQLAPGTAVLRFAKGIDRYKGIFQVMFHDYCSKRPQLEWINMEQDLGLANFRQTKRSYQPERLLSKFRVRLAGPRDPAT